MNIYCVLLKYINIPLRATKTSEIIFGSFSFLGIIINLVSQKTNFNFLVNLS